MELLVNGMLLMKVFDYDQAERSIKEGYDRTMEKMETITKLLDNHI